MKRRLVGYALWATAMGVFFIVPGMLVLAVVPLTILAVGLLLEPPKGVFIRRTLPEGQIRLGEEVEISLTVRATKGIGLIVVRETPHPGLRPQGKLQWVLFKGIRPLNATVRYRIKVEAWGHLEIPRTEVLSLNPLGIRNSWGVYGSKSKLFINLPANVPTMREVGLKRRGLPGSRTALKGVASMDFKEVRQYQPGDSVKTINWKATARTGQFMANEYEMEARGTVLLVIDARPDTEPGKVGGLYSQAVELASLLAGQLLENEYHVGLYLLGKGKFVLPSSGSKHLRRIIHEMGSQGGGYATWEGLDEAVMDIAGQITHYSPTILMITRINPVREASLKRGVYMLRGMYRSRTPLFIVDIVGNQDTVAGALRTLEKKAIRKLLISYGAKVVVWNTKTAGADIMASRVLGMIQ